MAELRVEGLVSYSIDFPEEDEPPVPPERIDGAAAEVEERLGALLRTAPQGELLRSGATIVLAGRPNSGKSSLFNALLGLERAIVTDVPGTTRDALEAVITLDGYPFRLVDTAGLREASDEVERIGIEVARRYLEAANLVLFCAPGDRALEDEERTFLGEIEAERLVLVRTMADLETRGGAEAASNKDEVILSARTGVGLDVLRSRVVERAFGALQAGSADAPLVTRQRQARALESARLSVEQFRTEMGDGVPMEFAATHLRDAVSALEELIGVVSPDDVLGEVFGSFCVGK